MFQETFPYPSHHPAPLKILALELVQALAEHFPFSGRMELSRAQGAPSLSYQNSSEGIALLQACQDIELISIQDHHFSLLLDHTEAGIELVYVPLNPLEKEIYQAIRARCVRILARLAAESR